MSAIFAVHISDGVFGTGTVAIAAALAALVVVVVARRMTDDEIARLGLLTAALFVASQIHIRMGVTSVHLLLNAVAGIILGPRVVIALAVSVFLQALLFAHGGLSAWGVNLLSHALPALLAPPAFRFITRKFPREIFAWSALAGVLASTATVLLSCGATYFFGVDSTIVISVILIANLPVIALEGIITGSLCLYLLRVKPEWLANPAAPVPPAAPPTDRSRC